MWTVVSSRSRWTSTPSSTFATSRTPRTRARGEREIEEDDLTTAFYERDEIDLGHLMAGAVLSIAADEAVVPYRLSGLCPECGMNLNRGTCECKRDWEDPRLKPLKALQDQNHKGH